MNKNCLTGIVLCIAGGFSSGAFAQDGRTLAATCAACHGTGGKSVGIMPPLAGVDKEAMMAAMQAFKHGLRPGTIMPQLAKGYSDLQIADVADFFSRQKP